MKTGRINIPRGHIGEVYAVVHAIQKMVGSGSTVHPVLPKVLRSEQEKKYVVPNGIIIK